MNVSQLEIQGVEKQTLIGAFETYISKDKGLFLFLYPKTEFHRFPA